MENGEDNQEDQHEEQSPFVPDLGLPSDESVNHGQGGNGAAAGGASGGEAPLSFRRFLEPAGPVSLGRPDVAAGLPDFVQDHLAPAAAAASTRQPAAAATGTRRKTPSSSACSGSGSAASLPTSQPLGLPDFLSDGPMGTLRSTAEGSARGEGADAERNGARLRPARTSAESTSQRIQRLERENACLRQDVERLQQQLQQERRRSASLQGQLSSSTAASAPPAAASAAAPAAAPGSPAEGADGRLLQQEGRSLRTENAELRRRAASELQAAAAGTELLISQLTSGLRNLRSIADSLSTAGAPGYHTPDPDPDLGRPPPGDPRADLT